MWTRLLGTELHWLGALAATAAALAIAWIVASLIARLARMGLLRALRGKVEVAFAAPIVRAPVRVIRAVVFLLIGFTLIVPALELAGAEIQAGLHVQTLVAWFLRSGLRVMLIAVLAFAVTRSVSLSVSRLESEMSVGEGAPGQERARRAKTLGNLIRNVVNTVVVTVAGLMVLHELEINIMPILTGAGILGLAVGFGAQTLVRDIISGFFLILEDQVRVGDVVTIGGTSGLVEAINLRTTVLRDLEGTVHVIPNGSVDRVSNRTKDFSYFLFDVGVAYKEDTDTVVEVIKEVADELRRDPRYRPVILEPLEALGVDAFADSQVTIRVRLKTMPLKQWEVGRELRRRIKKAFDARGIEIPFPHRTIYLREDSRPGPPPPEA